MTTTGLPLDLRHARHYSTYGVLALGRKRDAVAYLDRFRACGRNRDRDIEVHQAETFLTRFWVISRPDHYNGITYLMRQDGSWVAGRLTDNPTGLVPWTPLGLPSVPATVIHDYQYSAGQVGVCHPDGTPITTFDHVTGRSYEVTHWGASAWCIACNWSVHDSREDVVRCRARYHRANPTAYTGHQTPRRRPDTALTTI